MKYALTCVMITKSNIQKHGYNRNFKKK